MNLDTGFCQGKYRLFGVAETEWSIVGVLVDQLVCVNPEPGPAHVSLVFSEENFLNDAFQLKQVWLRPETPETVVNAYLVRAIGGTDNFPEGMDSSSDGSIGNYYVTRLFVMN